MNGSREQTRPSVASILQASLLAGGLWGLGLGILSVLYPTSFFLRCVHFLYKVTDSQQTIAFWERFIPAFVAVFALGGLGLGLLYLVATTLRRARRTFASVASFTVGGLAGFTFMVYTFAYLYQAEVIIGKKHLVLFVLAVLGIWLVGSLLLWVTALILRRLFRPSRGLGIAATITLWMLLLIIPVSVLSHSGVFGSRGKASWQVRIEPTGARVLMIGLDGADWEVMDPLLAQGQLPNIARLISEGVRCTLVSQYPLSSPCIWTTIATGKFPEKHGIQDFVAKIPGTTQTVPVSSAMRRCSAIWNIVSAFGNTVGISGYYVSWPAEEVNGFVISDRADYVNARELPRVTYPEDLIDMVAAISTEGYHQSLCGDVTYARAAIQLTKEDPKDLLCIYLRQVDVNQHRYWHQLYPEDFPDYEPTEQDRTDPVIPRTYREADRLIGEILKDLTDRSTSVFVFSDHGFESGHVSGSVTFYTNRLFERLGWLSHQEGSEEIDWSRTHVFDAGKRAGDNPRNASLNVQGREPEGIVSPSEARDLAQEYASQLREIRTPTGHKLFRMVKILDAEEDGDLRLTLNEAVLRHETHIRLDSGDVPLSVLTKRNAITGQHNRRGVLIASGNNIRRGKRAYGYGPLAHVGLAEYASVVDITPTILYALGYPVAADMDGKILTSLFEPEFVREHPPKYAESLEVGSGLDGRMPVESAVDEEALGRLRALGYIK